jgi:hypothetical protein
MPTYLRAASALVSVVILTACATNSAGVKPPAAASLDAQNPACVTQTGSRITGDKTRCLAPGRTYSSEDIDRTGATNAGDALQLMDPSITVHR